MNIQQAATPHLHFDRAAKALLVAAVFSVPISTALTNIFASLMLLSWLLAGGFRNRYESIQGNWLAYSAAGLFALFCIGSTYSTSSSDDILFQLHKYAKLLIIIPVITLLQDKAMRDRALTAFVAAMLITLALSLISVVWPLSFVKGTSGGATGNHFVFRDHIAQSLMMSFFTLIMLIKGYHEKALFKRIVFFSIGLLSTFDILFFVLGRTGYVSLALNFLVFFFICLSNLKERVITALIALAIIILTISFSDGFNSRIHRAVEELESHTTSASSSVGQRVEFVRKTFDLMREKPIMGYGTGSHQKEYCRVGQTPEWCAVDVLHPHNQFLSFGVQFGVIGILAYLMFIGACIRQSMYQSAEFRILGMGMVATLIVDSFFHAPLFLVAEAAFFILLLPVFLGQNSSSKSSSAHHMGGAKVGNH
jgi:O-antigen ligase